MIRLAIYSALMLVIAGLVHLSTVLALPWLATHDGYARLAALARDNEMVLVSASEADHSLPFSDPAVAMAVCRYVIDKGPVRVRVASGPSMVSLVFLRKGAGVFQSFSDRAATQGILDVIVATQDQIQKITALDSDEEPVQELRIVSADEIGIVLVKAVIPTPSQRGEIEALLATATCEGESLDR